MIRWVTIKKFASESGYMDPAVRAKIQDEKWPSSVWIKAPYGHILINIEEYEKWVESAREAPARVRNMSGKRSSTLGPSPRPFDVPNSQTASTSASNNIR